MDFGGGFGMSDETSRKIAVILLGPPGAGKGTQAKLIAESFQVPHISTGEILRENVTRGTELGLQAKAIMARGDLVPDTLVCDMVAWRVHQPDAVRGFVLDGFPRTPAQAGWLDAFLEHEFFDNQQSNPVLPIVIRIDVEYNQLLRRLAGRRNCPAGHIYNVYLQPPRVADICDVDGLPLAARNDDREEVVRERLATYERQTRPVADYYWKKGRLACVNGDLPIGEVTAQMARIVGSQGTNQAGK